MIAPKFESGLTTLRYLSSRRQPFSTRRDFDAVGRLALRKQSDSLTVAPNRVARRSLDGATAGLPSCALRHL